MVGGLFALSACSTSGHGNKTQNGMEMSDANGGAQASGVGQGAGFGDQNGEEGGRQGLSKRVYYFDFDKSDIHDEDKPAISAQADYLVAHPNARAILEGHTDPRGSREYNVALGERRANAVAEFLKSKGVNSSQVQVVSYGAQRLAVPGRTERDYQLDRRVVLVYSRK
jgi:peptidoglycan-associated lipoprotein